MVRPPTLTAPSFKISVRCVDVMLDGNKLALKPIFTVCAAVCSNDMPTSTGTVLHIETHLNVVRW